MENEDYTYWSSLPSITSITECGYFHCLTNWYKYANCWAIPTETFTVKKIYSSLINFRPTKFGVQTYDIGLMTKNTTFIF
jgi:hypothetical protein